ncbi:tRNA pseudouridine synthase A [Alkaliphilus metalliredigens QYMF]|uniref:tRNA pseudouridine synthase A n=1 Tax=Alkaliphilus metalliredigens (strain QYMF) TaxID=293826 RepID=A6TWE8_ALKMQ|nr:tRNA pseudouridine(38-40) synthase TruA [Alkaliphilus metalliredigens]ABR50516.1 tRNA pseudouridine synthase A [Alkaliphilus metalliredigens QYMF]
MRNIMIEIEYDGTNYSGWQIQQNAPSIQEEIAKALKKVTGEEITTHGSGRTDAGVHAQGQVASFQLHSKIPAERISFALNGKLPRDITILEAKEMPEDFHARYSAIGKRYGYCIMNNTHGSALLRNYCYHVPYKLDLQKMKQASETLLGTHDFKGFMASGSQVKSTVRRIDEINFDTQGSQIWITMQGNGFLYKMVRIIVGSLVGIGTGKIKEEALQNILETQNRRVAVKTAPAQGLYLQKVFYPLTHQGHCIII